MEDQIDISVSVRYPSEEDVRVRLAESLKGYKGLPNIITIRDSITEEILRDTEPEINVDIE
jgi:hypothetical protein